MPPETTKLLLLLVACFVGTASPLHGMPRSVTKTWIKSGILQVVGEVEEDGPCKMLVPVLSRQYEGSLIDCKYVELKFLAYGAVKPIKVYDLWLVSGPTEWSGEEGNPVVDFYEPITRGRIGDTDSGDFEFTRHQVGNDEIVIFEGRKQ